MIFITGDTHADLRRFNTSNFPEQKNMTKKDTVIICGDFGCIWNSKHIKHEVYQLNWLETKSFTTVFIEGNHDQFQRLQSFPVKEWNGGKVHEIRPSVLHLMRGEVYTIEGKKFFAFGGASSYDISDGILNGDDPDWKEQARKLEEDGKYMYRIKGLTWWPEELPSEEEMRNGLENLKKHNNKVDFIITHTPPASVIDLTPKGYAQDKLTTYLEEIKLSTTYKKWYAGHLHMERRIDHKMILVYENITRIN